MRNVLLTLCALALAAPFAAALVPGSSLYVFPATGSVSLDVSYSDGVGTTKFGFEQVGGRNGGPSQRLVAGALCTEWDGTFTQVLVLARGQDHASDARLAVFGSIATGGTTRETPGFTFDALGGPGAWEGVLIVCDDPAGPGTVHFAASLARTPVVGADPAVIRLAEG